MQVLIVFASATGRTKLMAEACAEGVRDAGAEAVLRSAAEATNDELLSADAVMLGSGIHMAGVEASMSGFLERTSVLWLQGKLVGKLGAAFASSGMGARGGGELVLLSMLATLAEHGMLLVPMHNRLEGIQQAGCHRGPVAWTAPREGTAGPTSEHLSAARAHGRFVAECGARWLRGSSTAA
jgi:NAD(P)H dehydrogenase (quinone)